MKRGLIFLQTFVILHKSQNHFSMKQKILLSCLTLFTAASFVACNNQPANEQPAMDSATATTKTSAAPNVEPVTYTADTVTMNGFAAWDDSNPGKRPVVLVVHEWWGLNDYIKNRIQQLAKLGYFAFAVDLYGNGKLATDPQAAQTAATPFYQKPQMAKERFEAALAKVKQFPQADTTQIAAIGYCFGGSMVLNMAKLGEPLVGVVSFHGGLEGVQAKKDLLKAKILVCHGKADTFVPTDQVVNFKKEMDAIGANYTFKEYDSATHAFTNPDATATGQKFNMPIKYNAAADSASWKDMRDFFGIIFK